MYVDLLFCWWVFTTAIQAIKRSDEDYNREIKIHVYRKRQTSDSRWEFLRIENKQIKTVPNNSYS